MYKIIIKEYKDFNKIVKLLEDNNEVKIDFSKSLLQTRIRILDLIAGYLNNKGKIKKETKDCFIITLN